MSLSYSASSASASKSSQPLPSSSGPAQTDCTRSKQVIEWPPCTLLPPNSVNDNDKTMEDEVEAAEERDGQKAIAAVDNGELAPSITLGYNAIIPSDKSEDAANEEHDTYSLSSASTGRSTLDLGVYSKRRNGGPPRLVTIPPPSAPYAQLCYHRAEDRLVTLMVGSTRAAVSNAHSEYQYVPPSSSNDPNDEMAARTQEGGASSEFPSHALPEVVSHSPNPGAHRSRRSSSSTIISIASSLVEHSCSISESSRSTNSDSTLLLYDTPTPSGGCEGDAQNVSGILWMDDAWLLDHNTMMLLYYSDHYGDSDDQLALLHNIHSDNSDDDWTDDLRALNEAGFSCGKFLLLRPVILCKSKRKTALYSNGSGVRLLGTWSPKRNASSEQRPTKAFNQVTAGKLYEYAVLH